MQSESASSSRRALLRAGAGAAALGALGGLTSGASARPLAAATFGSPAYDAALAAKGGVKAVFQSPFYDATIVAGNFLNHLLLLQLKNWLNSFQFAYKMAATDLHTFSATYASANLLNYGDVLWEKYKLGEKYKIIDPATKAPAVRNPFVAARFGPNAPKDYTAPNNYYQDTGIEVLQQRGTIFLTCNNSLNGHASGAVADGRAPAGMAAADVVADFQANLIPGAVLTPAVVGEVSRAQAAGYSLLFIPNFAL
jgi:hypothetical protein